MTDPSVLDREPGGFHGAEASPRRRRLAPFVALAVGLVLVGVVAALALASGRDDDTADSPLLGKPAPAVRTTTIDGDPFDLGSRRGSWVVLNFFATWCPPCLQEHPELVRFARTQATRSDGAELVTVVNNDEPEQVQRFFAEQGGEWPVLQDPIGDVYVGFGVSKVPETWVIDPNGIVRARIVTTVTAESLTAVLDELRGSGA